MIPTQISTLIPTQISTLIPTQISTLIPTQIPTLPPIGTLIPSLTPPPIGSLVPSLTPPPIGTLIPTLIPTLPPIGTMIPTLLPSTVTPTPNPLYSPTPTVTPGGPTPVGTPLVGVEVHLCGRVTSYTAATATNTGMLVLDGIPIVLAARSALTGSGLLTTGNDVCLTARLNLAGQVTSGQVTALATVSFQACGRISAYQAATANAAGSLVIGGRSVSIAPGATLQGQDLLVVGNDVCLSANLDATGRLVDGVVSGSMGGDSHVNTTGVVHGFQPATASAPGSVTIGGMTLPIAAGTTLVGQELLTEGATVSLRGDLNLRGQLQDGVVTLNGGATVDVCGRVEAFQAARANAGGWLTISGQSFSIAPGTTLDGQDLLRVGTDVCLHASLAASGEISGGTVRANAVGAVRVQACGMVTAFQAASSHSNGLLAIANQVFEIAAGTTLVGQDAVEVGGNYCMSGTVDANGALKDGTIALSGSGSLRLCGTVHGYQAATETDDGHLQIGDQELVIAQGARLTGDNLLREGANVCIGGDVDASGRLENGTVTANGAANARVDVCGSVNAFQAATASAPGSITIGSQRFVIAAGTLLDGQDDVRLGADYCLTGHVDASGALKDGSIRASAGTEVRICGAVTAFQAARAQAPGSITIGGQTLTIDAGTALVGQDTIRVGSNYCLVAGVNATGEIEDGSIALQADSDAHLSICGEVTAYQAATETAEGVLTIAGRTLHIAPGTQLDGQDEIQVGSQFCLDGSIGADGRLTDGSISISGRARLCGVVTAMGAGRIELDGRNYALSDDVEVDGGVGVCASACVEFDATGRVVRITANVAATAHGTVTAYSAGRSIAIDGHMFPLATRAKVDAGIRVGARARISLNGASEVVCAELESAPTPGGPTITPGGPAVTPGGPTITPGGPTITPGGPGTTPGTPRPAATVTPGGQTPAPTPHSGLATICGIVYDAKTLRPISGATVELFGTSDTPVASTRTGTNGAYCLYDISTSTYLIVGTHPRYDPDVKTVTPLPDKITWIDLYLTPRTGPVPGPTATPGGSATPTATATSIPGGPIVPPSTPPPGPTPRGNVPPGPIPDDGTLIVYVFKSDTGKPIPGAIVQVFNKDGDEIASGMTLADGHRTFTHLEPGPVTVLARIADCPTGLHCESRLVPAVVVAGEVRRVDIVLPCRGGPIYLPYLAKNELLGMYVSRP